MARECGGAGVTGFGLNAQDEFADKPIQTKVKARFVPGAALSVSGVDQESGWWRKTAPRIPIMRFMNGKKAKSWHRSGDGIKDGHST